MKYVIKLFLLVATLSLTLWQSIYGQGMYTVIDLGSLGGAFLLGQPNAINDKGHVVGKQLINGKFHGFIWKNGIMNDLGSLGNDTDPTDINNRDQVVGTSVLTSGEQRAFRWQNDSMISLGTLGGAHSRAEGINDSGQVVGWSQTSSGSALFLWQNDSMTALPISEGNEAQDIANNGHIIGVHRVHDSVSTFPRAFIFRNGVLTDLERLPGHFNSNVVASNESDAVVGSSSGVGGNAQAYYWRNGGVTMINTLGGNISFTTGLNDSGQVVGLARDATLQDRPYIWKDGTLTDLQTMIDPNSGWTDLRPLAINNRSEIAGLAFRNGSFHPVLLTNRTQITRPQAGERWIAGEQDTIRLSGRQLGQFIAVDYSTDSGSTYTNITSSLLADSLIWSIPANLLSTRAKVRVRTIVAPLDTAVSDTFRIKGYVLTRMTPQGHYDPFLPTDDGWSFVNAAGNFWPAAWWGQFQYAGGIDRHTGVPFDPAFPAPPVFAIANDFVDWPTFVDVFGRDACFWSFSNIYRDNTVERWKNKKSSWNGSCFGVAQSAMLYFHYREQFRQRHPSILPTDRLATIQVMTDSIRQINNRYFAMQFGKVKRDHDVNNSGTTPRQTLQQIRQMWANDNPDDDAGLKYRDPAGSGGHAVIPYSLQRSTTNPNQFQLFVCNSNNPASLADFILIDSLANTWQEFTGFGWGVGTTLMHLYPPALGFFSPPIFPSGPSSGLRDGGGRTEIWSPHRSDVRILAPNGDSIGVSNGHAFNTIPDAEPVVLETGYPQPPLGYDVPTGGYLIRVSNPVDTNIAVSVRVDSVSITYSRSGVNAGQRDEFWFNNRLGMKNPDAVQKTINVQVLAASDSSDRTANFTGVAIVQNDSVSAGLDMQARPTFVNFGPSKSYQLKLRTSSGRGLQRFESVSLNVPAQSTHIIAARWDSLATTLVQVYVDFGNNGTIDDTIFVNNTVDVDDRGSLEMPTEYNLAQNYPNPFNPNTKITYALPQASHVRLSVYNVLGQLVATLVDEERPAGQFVVEWNGTGTNGARVGSGVYFYTMVAHGVSTGQSIRRTGKMILLK